MTFLVVSNDVIPAFGVPVAAPGIRAAGLAEGLRAAGHEVELTVPASIIEQVWTGPTPPTPPPGVSIVDPVELADFIAARQFSHVAFTNANMAPHLQPTPGTTYIFDMFAPKILELLSSGRTDRDWEKDAAKKERAMALADHVWVNGRRKIGYALGWLLRPSVERIRTEKMGKRRLITGDPMRHVSLVEMPVPLPDGVEVRAADHGASTPLRVGVAGYVQRWSALDDVSPAQHIPLELGHEVHMMAPTHWGGSGPETSTDSPFDHPMLTTHRGPLDYPSFARWVQSMDVVADAFEQSAERTMAMITRSAVALRFGVPIVHGVDSEISDLIREYDAGWVVPPSDHGAWKAALTEAAMPELLLAKQRGAVRLSEERFSPKAALADAAKRLPNQ
jgi:hypothetical protein